MQQENIFHNVHENDPKQLKQVIEALISKTRVLIQSLEETWEKLEGIETQKNFWKDSYFNLRDACQQYVDNNGLTPFNYIVSLQEQLKKEKVYKSCLEEKFKIMRPGGSSDKRRVHGSDSSRKECYQGERKEHLEQSWSSTIVKGSPHRVKFQNKHKIGPKNIEFFKFGEQRSPQ